MKWCASKATYDGAHRFNYKHIDFTCVCIAAPRRSTVFSWDYTSAIADVLIIFKEAPHFTFTRCLISANRDETLPLRRLCL